LRALTGHKALTSDVITIFSPTMQAAENAQNLIVNLISLPSVSHSRFYCGISIHSRQCIYDDSSML